MAEFRLSKWYLDCVTESGDISICYTGTVKWALAQLHYSSLLEVTGAIVASSQSLREQHEPEVRNDSIHWQNEALHASGEWQTNAREIANGGIHNTIFSSQEGSIDWHCLIPCGPARIGQRSGLGYVEHLTLTIPPWRLPIQTLRWGRFTSHFHSVVWIDCSGGFSRRIAYVNGLEVAAPVIQDDVLEFGDGTRLELDRSLVVRQGPLGTTALSAFVSKTLPARIFQVNECKWRSRARLHQPSGSTVEGWAIHERVDWPR